MNVIVMNVAVCLVIGYFIGSFSPSYIICKLRGYDVRTSGSLNAGASNTVIIAGKRAGFVVAVTDILKAAGSWLLCQQLFPDFALAGPLGGIAAQLGHMFPVFLGFHGGKGLACLGGIILAYSPRTFLLMLGIALFIGFVTNYVCFVTVGMSAIWPVYYGVVTGFWLGALVLAVPALPIFCKHLINFRRIKTGEELRLSYLWKKDEELKRIGRQ